MKSLLALVFFILLFAESCNSKQQINPKILQADTTGNIQEDKSLTAAKLVTFGEGKERKFTKTGYIKFKENNLNKCKTVIDSLLKKYNGELMSENYEKTYLGTYNFKTSLPAKYFSVIISNLKSIFGEPENISLTIDDFTKNYYDTETRLKSKKAYLESCLDLLHKAKKIEDIITIEEKVSDVQEEIEEMTGNLKTYDYQVDNYSLTVEFVTDEFKSANSKPGFFANIALSFSSGWYFLINMIYIFISGWPVWLLLLILMVIFLKIRKRWRQRKTPV